MICDATTSILWFRPFDKPRADSRLLIFQKSLGVEKGWFDGQHFRNFADSELKDEWVDAWAYWPEEPHL